MATYKVTGRMVRINGGVLELSEAQADARMHHLKHLKGNKYEVVNPVEFKNDEEFGYSGEVNKALAEDLALKSKLAAEDKAAKAKAEAEAKAAAEAAEKQRLEAEKARKESEEFARKCWDDSEEVRKQFDGDFDAYLKSELGE